MQNRLLTSRLAQRATAALATALPALSFAQGLPQLENPTRGTGSGIMETIRNYGYDIIMLVALLVVASMFIGVCYHAYGTYAEIHTGRKTWGQFRPPAQPCGRNGHVPAAPAQPPPGGRARPHGGRVVGLLRTVWCRRSADRRTAVLGVPHDRGRPPPPPPRPPPGGGAAPPGGGGWGAGGVCRGPRFGGRAPRCRGCPARSRS